MARTAVTVTALTPNAGTTEPAGTTADPTNGHVVDPTGDSEALLLRCANTAGTPKNAIVKAGANPPALDAGLGDLTVQVPATSGVRWIGPLTSGRFIQADGKVNVDLESGFAGTVTAYRVPRTA